MKDLLIEELCEILRFESISSGSRFNFRISDELIRIQITGIIGLNSFQVHGCKIRCNFFLLESSQTELNVRASNYAEK